MKKIIYFAFILVATTFSCYAQPDMGDAELNASLATIVKNAKVHFSDFRHYVVANYGITNNRYDYLESIMTPGDIYLAVEITKVSKKSLTDITNYYNSNKAKGWVVIAKEFGVTPGSSAFEAIKDHAYKMANGTDRPKPKPVVKPTAKPKTKTTTKPKTKATTTTKPKAKQKPK